DEDLPLRIGEMLFGTNDMRDLHVILVDHAGQVVEAGAVRALDDVVLLAGPFDGNRAADQVSELASSFARHLQARASLAAFGFKPGSFRGRRGHPLAAVEETALLLLCGRALAGDLLIRGVIVVGEAALDELLHRLLIATQLLRLVVGTMGAP